MKTTFSKYLPEFVYGSIDGTVTTFAVVAGVSGAALSPIIVLVLGIANVLADGFSMASSNYLSERSRDSVAKTEALKTSFMTFISFVTIGFIPILPYIVGLDNNSVFFVSCILTGFTFFAIGFVKGEVVGQNKFSSAIETLLIGGAAATISFVVGFLLKGLV